MYNLEEAVISVCVFVCVYIYIYIYILGINLIDNPSFFIIGDFICFEKLDLNDKFYCDLVSQ